MYSCIVKLRQDWPVGIWDKPNHRKRDRKNVARCCVQTVGTAWGNAWCKQSHVKLTGSCRTFQGLECLWRCRVKDSPDLFFPNIDPRVFPSGRVVVSCSVASRLGVACRWWFDVWAWLTNVDNMSTEHNCETFSFQAFMPRLTLIRLPGNLVTGCQPCLFIFIYINKMGHRNTLAQRTKHL